MSTIPSGLTALQMKQRMEDKATITKTGSMYMGGTTAVSYQDVGTTVPGYDTIELAAGAQYYPLISQGSNSVLVYGQLPTGAFVDNAITKNLLGNGAIQLTSNGNRKEFSYMYSHHTMGEQPDNIFLSIGSTSYNITPEAHKAYFHNIKNQSAVDCNAIRLKIDNTIEAVWCKSYTLTETKPSYGFQSAPTYIRTANQLCSNLDSGDITPNTSYNIYYGDQIMVSYTALNAHYTITCVQVQGSTSTPVSSGGNIAITKDTSVQFTVIPDQYTLTISTAGTLTDYGVTLLTSPSRGISTPTELHSGDTLCEGDTIRFHATTPNNIDYILHCESGAGSPTRTYNIGTTYVVDHDNLTFDSQNNIAISFNGERITYQLSLTLHTGVQAIRYKTTTSQTWTNVTSTQSVSINSGDNVYLQFTPASGYIAQEGYYKVTTTYGNQYRIQTMRSNQSWTPEVYLDGASRASVSATATTSGSRRTYSLTFANRSEYRENLMGTNVGVDVSGESVIGGGSRTFSATVQGLTPIYDNYCYVHFYIGPSPFSAETTHYGVTGTYTHD